MSGTANPFYDERRVAELVRAFACPPAQRAVLADFEHNLRQRHRDLRMYGLRAHVFENYLRRRLRRGEPVGAFAGACDALRAFAASVDRTGAFDAAARGVAEVIRLTRQTPCWVLEPYSPPGERLLVASGLPRHGATACVAGCTACRVGVRMGHWWTLSPALLSRLPVYADRSTYELYIDSARRAQDAAIRLSRATSATIDIPAPPGLAYLPFQKAGIAYVIERHAALIGDEMGLGKTVQALGVVNANPSLARILVVCPATLLANWRREAERWLVRQPKIHVCETNAAPPEDATFVIVSYNRIEPMRDALMGRSWDILIADEAHYAKNPDARRTRILLGWQAERGIISRARRLLFLTGIPVLNDPSELLTLLRALDPVAFAPSRVPCDPWRLQQLLRQNIMVRRLKAEVLPELPPKRHSVIVLSREVAEHAVAEEQRILLRHAEIIRARRRDVVASVGNKAAYTDALRSLRDARSEARGDLFRARHAVALAKVPAVIQHVRKLVEEDGVPKLVLWAHHRDVLAAITAPFEAMAVMLSGDTPPSARDGLVTRFQTDPSCRLFAGSLHAAGQGITLTAAAHAVFAELDWTPAILAQAEDRCHRIGQVESLLVEHLVVDESIDALLARKLVTKQAIIDRTLDQEPENPGDKRNDDDDGFDLVLAAA